MNNLTLYRPRNGQHYGPTFDTMTLAACWCIQQPNQGEWDVELIRDELMSNEELADRMNARHEADKALLALREARSLIYAANLAHDQETESHAYPAKESIHD